MMLVGQSYVILFAGDALMTAIISASINQAIKNHTTTSIVHFVNQYLERLTSKYQPLDCNEEISTREAC